MQSTLCGRPVAGDRALIMAIVNRTPDSFYDRGATFGDDAARAAAHGASPRVPTSSTSAASRRARRETSTPDTETLAVVPFIEWLRDTYPTR